MNLRPRRARLALGCIEALAWLAAGVAYGALVRALLEAVA